MVDPNEKRRLVQQLINDFKSRDGGFMYSLEPAKWNSYFEQQAEQMLRSKAQFTTPTVSKTKFTTPKIEIPKKVTPKPTKKTPELDHWSRALDYQNQGQWEMALFEFKMAAQINPNIGDYWFFMGDCYHALGKYNEAIYCFQKTIELEPTLVKGAWYCMGLSFQMLGDYFMEIESYKKVLEIEPNDVDAQIALDVALKRFPQYQKEKRNRR